jgi:hypothetical protein
MQYPAYGRVRATTASRESRGANSDLATAYPWAFQAADSGTHSAA